MTRRPLVPGWCILCRQAKLVCWIGPVEHNGQQAPAYACEDCCQFVREYIDHFTQQWDQRPAM
jgi:hypothetical protein